MTLAAIASGDVVFVDANIFIFYFRPDPVLGPACNHLLQRIETGDVQGFTSAHVLTEMAHRLMADEAMQRYSWPLAGIARRLRTHPPQVRALTRHRQAIDELALIGVQVLPVTGAQVSVAADIICQHGLLAGDALTVSMMQDHSLALLASHDRDFDRIPGITRFGPP
jgi:predicted nucleic acid-binding protein